MNARHLALSIVAAALMPVVLSDYQVTLMNYVGLASLVALGLVLLTGFGGLTSFGQATFVGFGAYTSAYLTTTAGVSPWLTLLAGLAVSGGAALVIGLATLRLSGHYLPLSTIAWSPDHPSVLADAVGGKEYGAHLGSKARPNSLSAQPMVERTF